MDTIGKEPERFYGRPRDESLQAYKDFILDMLAALNPQAESETTEDQWRQPWQQFWWGAEDNSAPETKR